jgi:hypothetical protein
MKFINVSRLAVGLIPMALALSVSTTYAGDPGVDVNIHLGNQPRQVVVNAPVVTIEQDVDFIFPSSLGFYVAVGVPYDLFFVQNSYYLWRDGRWFRAPGSHGPWMAMQQRNLPPGLRRHKLERIRAYRNAEYDVYHRDRDHYRGKHFMTGKDEWKEHRKAEKENRKEEKRENKKFRKDEKRDDKEYRKDVKRAEKEDKKADKEERKQHKGGKKDKD